MRVQSLAFLFKHTCKCSQLFTVGLTKFSNMATAVTFSAKKHKLVNTDKGEISHIIKYSKIHYCHYLDILMVLQNYTDRGNTEKMSYSLISTHCPVLHPFSLFLLCIRIIIFIVPSSQYLLAKYENSL